MVFITVTLAPIAHVAFRAKAARKVERRSFAGGALAPAFRIDAATCEPVGGYLVTAKRG
jgi:hypothetical protein